MHTHIHKDYTNIDPGPQTSSRSLFYRKVLWTWFTWTTSWTGLWSSLRILSTGSLNLVHTSHLVDWSMDLLVEPGDEPPLWTWLTKTTSWTGLQSFLWIPCMVTLAKLVHIEQLTDCSMDLLLDPVHGVPLSTCSTWTTFNRLVHGPLPKTIIYLAVSGMRHRQSINK